MLTGAIASFLTSASPIHNPVLSAFGAMKGYPSSILLVTSVAAAISGQVGISEAFSPKNAVVRRGAATGEGEHSPTALFKGAKNAQKQLDLARKMAAAKEKKQTGKEDVADDDGSAAKNKKKSSEDVKAENDRRRFEDLLNSETAAAMSEFNKGSGYLTKAQEEEAATAGFRGVDRKYEGDPAPAEPFTDLVGSGSENALGEQGAERLVPWLRGNADRSGDYLIVVTDPREKSNDLRRTMVSLASTLPKPMMSRTIFINADTPAENRRWLKKNKMGEGDGGGGVNIYSDEKREWMREYTALGERRWSMCLFVLQDGVVRRLVRELDADLAPSVVQNAGKSL